MLQSMLRSTYAKLRPTAATRHGTQAATDIQFVRWTLGKGLLPGLRGLRLWRGPWRAFKLIYLGRGARIGFPELLSAGRGCAIGAYSQLNCLSSGGVVLGDRVTLREFAWLQLTSSPFDLGECLEIGSDTYIGPFAVLGAGGSVRIGPRCQIGSNLCLSAEEHVIDDGGQVLTSGVTKQGIEIGAGCWLGNRVTVLDGVRIGEGCVIGAGSVVTRDIPPNAVAVGSPASVIRFRPGETPTPQN